MQNSEAADDKDNHSADCSVEEKNQLDDVDVTNEDNEKGDETLLERAGEPRDDSCNENDDEEEDDDAVGDSFIAVDDKQNWKAYVRSPAFILFTSQGLSAWGDRMWTFAVGLYLVAIEMNSLRLTAIYGLVLGLSALMFGAIIGNWIDAHPRLKVVRLCLLFQNAFIIGCASLLGLLIAFQSEIGQIWNDSLTALFHALIICFGAIANLASIGNKIAIQKDWVVVVAGTSKGKLANLNAVLRRIDLVVNIIAPIVVGQIMTFASMLAGTIFIASWNIVSGFVEYYLLLTVYKKVPALAVKEDKTLSESEDQADEDNNELNTISLHEDPAEEEKESVSDKDLKEKSKREKKVLHQMFSVVLDFVNGWKVYMDHQVRFAGLGMAFLYMTVIGFDYITTGYGYSQGIPEWMIGVFRGIGSMVGILGTLLYPFLRKKIGLERTGLWAITEQLLSLIFCIVSIWAPGSPFDLHYADKISTNTTMTTTTMATSASLMLSIPFDESDNSLRTAFNKSTEIAYLALTENYTEVALNMSRTVNIMTELPTDLLPNETPVSRISISIFFTGIICARLGLWMFDLTVTQIIQENVRETQRGVFNGVQNSLNSFMEMLHFVLVIVAPRPETFGLLIIISFVFVFTGDVLYWVYCYRVRGHILPLHQLKQCGGVGKQNSSPKDKSISVA
ncbi:ferroportin-like isoform X2 [Ptychodera flava]|uniref:ferroportin-like isoform X2 n=1 Tax=Ptychodera flava TaxID=63121 RepID=UPI00396A9043